MKLTFLRHDRVAVHYISKKEVYEITGHVKDIQKNELYIIHDGINHSNTPGIFVSVGPHGGTLFDGESYISVRLTNLTQFEHLVDDMADNTITQQLDMF